MNILDIISNASDGAAVRQVGSRVGLSEADTASALSALVPALAAGFRQNAQSPDGLAGLVAALSGGNHQQYLDEPGALDRNTAIDDGNDILGRVFGSKDTSREVANRAAAQTGLGADVMKQLLPLAATLMMGAMSRQSAGAGAGAGPQTANVSGGDGLLDMLGGALDQNRDGSVVDDITGMIARTLGGR